MGVWSETSVDGPTNALDAGTPANPWDGKCCRSEERGWIDDRGPKEE